MQQAQTDLTQVAANLQRLYPAADKGRGITAVPLGQYVVGGVRTAMITLQAVVVIVLLIACANIANLMLTRAAGLRKEIPYSGKCQERNQSGANDFDRN